MIKALAWDTLVELIRKMSGKTIEIKTLKKLMKQLLKFLKQREKSGGYNERQVKHL